MLVQEKLTDQYQSHHPQQKIRLFVQFGYPVLHPRHPSLLNFSSQAWQNVTCEPASLVNDPSSNSAEFRDDAVVIMWAPS